MAYKKRRKRGVPKGYKHNWKYTGHWGEKKIAPGKWRIDFRATKGRRATKWGGYGKGTRIRWKINATQTAIKTGKGTYQTRLKGIKKLIRAKVRR